jgi:hypothetical protein
MNDLLEGVLEFSRHYFGQSASSEADGGTEVKLHGKEYKLVRSDEIHALVE